MKKLKWVYCFVLLFIVCNLYSCMQEESTVNLRSLQSEFFESMGADEPLKQIISILKQKTTQ